MGRFETTCERYLAEEKMAGHSVNGHFIYSKPTKEEIERITYEYPGDQKGFRALYYPPTKWHGSERLFAFCLGLTHNQVEEYIVENYIIDREEFMSTQAVNIEYFRYLGRVPKWREGRAEGVNFIGMMFAPNVSRSKLRAMLHLPREVTAHFV